MATLGNIGCFLRLITLYDTVDVHFVHALFASWNLSVVNVCS